MTLTEELAPEFWGELSSEGITPEDISTNRIKDLGSRLCEFMSRHQEIQAEAA